MADTEVDKYEDWDQTRKVVKRHESWKYYWSLFLFGFIWLGAVIACVVWQYLIAAALLGVLWGIFWLPRMLMVWYALSATYYEIDKDILKIRYGLLFKKRQEISVHDIADIRLTQSPKEKVLNTGTLYLMGEPQETDEGREQKPLCIMDNITAPQDLKDHILKVREMTSAVSS